MENVNILPLIKKKVDHYHIGWAMGLISEKHTSV